MGNLQARMPGLVSYLDLATEGRAPGDLAGIVQGYVDLERHLDLQKRERAIVSGVAAGGVVGAYAFLTVPPAEAWKIIAYTIQTSVLPIGLNVQIAPVLQLPMGGGNQNFLIGDPQTNRGLGFATEIAACWGENLPFIAPPGTILGGLTQAISALTAFTASLTVDFVRLRL